jgi:hypothetical protein
MRRACAVYYNLRSPAFVGSEIMTTYELRSINCSRMQVLNGKIYALLPYATVGNPDLYEWSGGDRWVAVANRENWGSTIGNDYTYTLTECDGKLYCLFQDAEGATAVSILIEWNGSNAWINRSSPLTNIGIPMVSFGNELYASRSYLRKWNGTDDWDIVSDAQYVIDLIVFNGKIYGTKYAEGILYEWNGINSWVAKTSAMTFGIYWRPLCVHAGAIYSFSQGLGTAPQMYKWTGSGEWAYVADFPSTLQNFASMYSFNGSLFVGTVDIAGVADGLLYKWNGTTGFDLITDFYNIAPTKEHQVYSMIDMGGYLYALTDYHLQRISTGSTQSVVRARLASYRIEV